MMPSKKASGMNVTKENERPLHTYIVLTKKKIIVTFVIGQNCNDRIFYQRGAFALKFKRSDHWCSASQQPEYLSFFPNQTRYTYINISSHEPRYFFPEC